MIRKLSIENLKCFESLELDFAPLTLFTGFNAAGKSTVLQALLLLTQTLRGGRGTSELLLNGPLVSLGSPLDVLNTTSGAKTLSLGVEIDGINLSWRFDLEEAGRRSLRIAELIKSNGLEIQRFSGADLVGLAPQAAVGELESALQALEQAVFLSASRQIESEVFPAPLNSQVRRGDVGVLGQFAPWWLYAEGDAKVEKARRTEPNAVTMRAQLNSWCNEVFPGAEANALPINRTSLMRLELRSGPTTDWGSPANIGYGVGYAFPILVAGLTGAPDRMVIIDSPEAHLHPRGQSQIGLFLARMASAGSQILLETHSDHLLNGLRIAVRKEVLKPQDVAIYFFSQNAASRVTRLSVDKWGGISDWPEGFFDQSERDLADLAGWER